MLLQTQDSIQEVLTDLNKEQKQAVVHDKGPLLIIAGAGTGKTSVITRRIAYLIAHKKALPSEILALTFTDKAASEMEERVDMLVPYGFNDVWISTFHAFGDRLLRENAFDIGISPDYKLLTPAEAAVFFKDNIFSFQMKYYRPLGNPAQFISSLLTTFSRAKDEDINPDEFIEYGSKQFDKASAPEEKEEAEKQKEVGLIYKKYEELKRKNNFLDFGDQVTLTLKLLKEHPSMLKKYQERYKYILVDEFQDTNYTQFELVKKLSENHGNITVVGDDDQSIYKFRGACLSNILHFKKTYPDCSQIVLRNNYRSTQPILDSAYKLITQNNPERLEVKNNINKELKSQKAEGLEVKHLHFDMLSTESDEVAKIIDEKIKSGKRKASDFAILVRSNDSALPFVKSLNMFGVPWRFSGSQGLYQKEEIRILLAFLRLMSSTEDSASLYYIATSSLYKFNPVDLAFLNSIASYNRRSLLYVLRNIDKYPETDSLKEETKKEIGKLLTDLNNYYDNAQNMRTGELLYVFLKNSGILAQLYKAKTYQEIEKAQNIAKFFKIIGRFGEITTYDRANRFMEYIEALLSAGDDPSSAEVEFDIDAVNVLTIHKAKGLEFPVVFMVSLVEDRFPARDRGEKIELPDDLIKDILPEGNFHIQEERRLFYVGMTRAKEELCLTSAKDYGGKRQKKVSRFVIEALDKPKADETFFKQGFKETIERFAPVSKSIDYEYKLPGTDGVLTLSPYAIDDYLTCPLKYKYIHVLRIPVLRHHTLVFGDVVHKVLKEYYKSKKENKCFKKDDIEKLYDTFWSSTGFLSRDHEEERYKNGKEILTRYYLQEEKTNIVPFSVEESFKVLLNDKVRVTGRWDRLDERTNNKLKERVVVDFKTTGRVKDQKSADKEIKQSRQLIIYALGHQMKYGELPAYVELHFLEPGLKSVMAINDKMIEKIKSEIQSVAEGIIKRDFSAQPAYLACQYCAYSNICPAKQA